MMRGRVIAYFLFSKRRQSAILDFFYIFTIFVKNSNLCLYLCHHTKYGEDRMMRGRVIACFQFSKWRPSAILDLHIIAIFCENSIFCLYLSRHAKFGEDRTIHGPIIAYFQFSKWRLSAILDLVWHYSRPPMACLMALTSCYNCTFIVLTYCEISRFLYLAHFAWNCLFTPLWGVLGDMTLWGIWCSPWNLVPVQGEKNLSAGATRGSKKF